jgi:hypothetical protein
MPERAFGFNRWLDFAPRLGLAWDPTGKRNMSIRAAWGMFYDYPHLYNYLGFSQGPPFGNSLKVDFPSSFTNPWMDYLGGNPFPLRLDASTTFPIESAYLTLPFDLKHPYMNQWNLSIQKGIGADWLLTTNYIGNNVIRKVDMKTGMISTFAGTGERKPTPDGRPFRRVGYGVLVEVMCAPRAAVTAHST